MQGYEKIINLHSEDQEVNHMYNEELSRVTVEVVQYYIEKISQHLQLPNSDLEKMCLLLNNLHAMRINIQDVFIVMGGEEVIRYLSEQC